MGRAALVLRDLSQPQQLQDSVILLLLSCLSSAELKPQSTQRFFCARFLVQILGKTAKLRCQCGSEVASKTARGKADLKPLHDESGSFFLLQNILDMKTFLFESFLVNKKRDELPE